MVNTFVSAIKENIDIVLETLVKGSRRIQPEYEVSIMDEVDMTFMRRPKSARPFRPKMRSELHREVDQWSGVEQHEHSRVLQSLSLENPRHSHRAVGLPRKMARRLNKSLSSISEDRQLSTWDQYGRDSDLQPELDTVEELTPDTGAILSQKSFAKKHEKDDRKKNKESRYQQVALVDIIKRNNQRTDALVKTLFDSTVPSAKIRECSRMVRKSDKKTFRLMTEATEGFLDSDEEDALHAEIDNIHLQAELEEGKSEEWWERQAARQFNQIALNIVNTEHAFLLFHEIMTSGFTPNLKPDSDPLLATEHIARSLVVLRTETRRMNLDQIVQDTHSCIKPFRLLLSPKERRENKGERACRCTEA